MNIVVRKSASSLKLFSGKNQSLLVRRDTLLVLDLCIDIIGRISDDSASSAIVFLVRLDEDLHAATEHCAVKIKIVYNTWRSTETDQDAGSTPF